MFMAAILRHFFNRHAEPATERAVVFTLRSAARFGAISALAAAAFAPFPARAQSTSLLTSGNFEAGSFAGWTVSNVRDPSDTSNTRNFYIDTPGTTTPTVDGYSFNTAANTLPGGGGNFYAVTTTDYAGESALLQGFTTPTVRSGQGLRLTFTFDWFVNDQSGYSNRAQDPSGLDYSTGGLDAENRNVNQYARVDLLRFDSGDFSTSASDVLFNVPLTVPLNAAPNDAPNPYQRYSVNLSPYVQSGTRYKIRFAEVDNSGALNLGVDNVIVQAEITPEPATLCLLSFAPALFVVRFRRRHSKNTKLTAV